MISSVHLPAEPSAASLALQHPQLLWEIEYGSPPVHSREHQNTALSRVSGSFLRTKLLILWRRHILFFGCCVKIQR